MRLVLVERRGGGFTLLEMSIVVLVLGILMAIAIPNWIRAQQRSHIQSCMANLRQIEQAKERYAIEYRRPNDAPVAWSDLLPAYLKQQPECPSGGEYDLNSVGEIPTCSVEGHELR
jgi:prepilin-type N-terminal cleavage/methylation domain-containing protein